MNLNTMNGRLAVITGGSSGIGLAFADRIASRGARLVLVARDETRLRLAADSLAERHGVGVDTVSADLTQPSHLERIHEAIAARAPAADLIVNSAGIVSAGLVHETPIDEWDRLYDINVRGLVRVLQVVVPAMIAAHAADGQPRHIVNIASAAGYSGVPGMAAYGSTKAAVLAMSESLRAELARHAIGVTAVSPGFVQTPIAETVQLFGSMNTPRTQARIQKLFALGKLSPETVADKTLAAVARNRGFVTVGKDARGAHWVKRLSPTLFSRLVANTATA